MNKSEIEQMAQEFLKTSEHNYVSEKLAFYPDLVGLKIYESLLMGVADANDELFKQLKEPNIVGLHHLLPQDFLPDAKTVISFFLSFTDRIRISNGKDYSWPSDEWQHGRIEGQQFILHLAKHFRSYLRKLGYKCVIPDNRELKDDEKTLFQMGVIIQTPQGDVNNPFTSNWSERHVAYLCGLGTLGLSKNIITKNGSCGRLVSFITDLKVEPDVRPYTRYDEYCTYCGKCANNCPVKAVDINKGKDHKICGPFTIGTMKNPPYYGCAKCQVNVPCATEIPSR